MKTVIVFILFLISYLYLIAGQSLFPFIDLPNHLAEATLYHLSENSVLDHYYEIEKGIEPNSFHYIFCSLFSSIELGNKIYYMLYVLLFPVSVALIIRQLNGNWKFTFLIFLLLFNYNVTFGFTGFTLAIPIALMAFYLAIVDKTWSLITLSFTLVLLFFVHILGLLFALLFIGALALFQFKGFKSFFEKTVVIVPALLIIFFWYGRAFKPEQSTAAFLIDYYKHHYIYEFAARGKVFVYDNFALAKGISGIAIGALFSVILILPIILYLHRYKYKISSIKNLLTKHREITILVFVSTFCCVFLPNELPGQGILYQRYSVFLFTSLIIVGSILYKESISPVLQGIALIAIVFHFALWANYLSDFDNENKSFNASLFKEVDPGKTMGGFIQDYEYRGRPVYIHFPNYNIVWNYGITTTKIIDYRFGSFRRKTNLNALPEYQEWAGSGRKIPEEYNTLNYILLKGESITTPSQATLVAHGNDWRIIKLN